MYHVSLQKYGSIQYCITISTVRITCHYSLKNQAVVEYVTDKLIGQLLAILQMKIRMSHKTCITQHYIATSILRYSWSTVSRYDIQSLYRYIAISICIADPYNYLVMWANGDCYLFFQLIDGIFCLKPTLL